MGGPNQNNVVLIYRIVLVPMVQDSRNKENVEFVTILTCFNACACEIESPFFLPLSIGPLLLIRYLQTMIICNEFVW